MSELRALTPREASIFACLTDTVVAPAGPLPAVKHTDAIDAFDRWLALSPSLNRVGMRALLYAVEVGPVLAGFSSRLRRLERSDRLAYVQRFTKTPNPHVRQLAKLLNGMATVCYYGDDAVMRQIGYDADANVRRGRELRRKEGRP